MLANENLPEVAPKSKAIFSIRTGRILLGTFDNAGDAWKQFDVLLASGVDVTIDVVPAVL